VVGLDSEQVEGPGISLPITGAVGHDDAGNPASKPFGCVK
jgi:hypothetical protein